MNALIIITIIIFFLTVIMRAVRNASSNKVEVCPRCKGAGSLELKGEEEAIECRRCKGTGQLMLGYQKRKGPFG